MQKETSEINLASLKQSIITSNDFFNQLRKILAKINQNRAVFLQQLILLSPQTKLKQSRLIGQKLVIYGLTEKIQDDKFVQIEREIISLQRMFRDRRELKEITVSDCFRIGKQQPNNSRPFVFTFHLLGIINLNFCH